MSVYASADWHGCYWVWEKVKDILSSDDKLIFIGDAADRGPDGWRLIKELLADDRVIYLKGNHDVFLTDAMRAHNFSYDDDFRWNRDMELWFWNGGETTYDEILADDSITPIEKREILNKLEKLPISKIYHSALDNDILLCHAGCNTFGNVYPTLSTDIKWPDEDLVWDRTHWRNPNDWYGDDGQFIVHGHTPIPLMRETQEDYVDKEDMPGYTGHGAYWYAGGHKICVDCGTVWTNEAVLLNLDTFEEMVIKKND